MSQNSFHEYLANEAFAELGDRVNSRKMFGGYGYYLDGRIFAILVSDGEIYFKVGVNNRQDFEKAGSEPFIYTGRKVKKPTTMPYWKVPDEILGNPEKLAEWAEKSAENSNTKKTTIG